jgi:hypothetical protein
MPLHPVRPGDGKRWAASQHFWLAGSDGEVQASEPAKQKVLIYLFDLALLAKMPLIACGNRQNNVHRGGHEGRYSCFRAFGGL